MAERRLRARARTTAICLALLSAALGIYAQGNDAGLVFGRYAVGYRVDSLVVRADTTAPGGRSLQVRVWYPARRQHGTPPLTYADYLRARPGNEPGADSDSALMVRLVGGRSAAYLAQVQRALQSPTKVVWNAPLARGRFPTILYAPGSGGAATENALLMAFLASHGFVLVASQPNGRPVPAGIDVAALTRTTDDLDRLRAYAGQLSFADTSRLAAMGFSWGGFAAVNLARRSSGVDAIVSLDGSVSYYYPRLRAESSSIDVGTLRTAGLYLVAGPTGRPATAAMGLDTTYAFFGQMPRAARCLVRLSALSHQNFTERAGRLSPGGRSGLAVADSAVQWTGYRQQALLTLAFLRDQLLLQRGQLRLALAGLRLSVSEGDTATAAAATCAAVTADLTSRRFLLRSDIGGARQR